MKRSLIPHEVLVLAAMALAFLVLASPAAASTPCLAIGEYYSAARHCELGHVVATGASTQLALLAALAGITTALVMLRRQVRRMRLPG